MRKAQRKAAKPKAMPSSRGLLERPTGPVARLAVYMPPELAVSAKVRAATERRTVSSLVIDALEEHLGAA